MAYPLSFTEDFFGDPNEARRSDRPTTIVDALASMSKKQWDEMAREVFGVSGDLLTLEMVLDKVRETNTCSDLKPPVEVWIDEDGYYTVLVYEPGSET